VKSGAHSAPDLPPPLPINESIVQAFPPGKSQGSERSLIWEDSFQLQRTVQPNFFRSCVADFWKIFTASLIVSNIRQLIFIIPMSMSRDQNMPSPFIPIPWKMRRDHPSQLQRRSPKNQNSMLKLYDCSSQF
jgi:hypothetical protein